MPTAKNALRTALITLALPLGAIAEELDVTDVSDLAYHLVNDAPCSDVMDAVLSVGSAQSDRQILLNTLFYVYASGYAAGASKPDDFVQVEMLTYCRDNPTQKISDFRF